MYLVGRGEDAVLGGGEIVVVVASKDTFVEIVPGVECRGVMVSLSSLFILTSRK